jgi:hypothetical protein
MATHDVHTAEVEIYPVGVLSDIQQFVHNPDRKQARAHARRGLRRLLELARERNWRALRNSFNGYLAEHATRGTRCGHGWTRGRAYRDLQRHLAELNTRRDGR